MLKFFIHEYKLIWREPRFLIPFFIPPLFIIGTQLYIQNQRSDAQVGASLLILIGVLLSTMSVNLMADAFAGERERNTLELLLSLPIPLEKIFFGKMLAVFPVPFIISALFQILFWNLTSMGAGELLIALCTNVSSCIFVGIVALTVSLFTQTVRTASQISGLFVLIVLIATPLYSVFIYNSLPLFFIVNGGYLFISGILVWFSFSRFRKRSWLG